MAEHDRIVEGRTERPGLDDDALDAMAPLGRLDRLEAAGHVGRRLDPENRRSMLVTLTARGRKAVDDAVTEHVDNEQELSSVLSAADRRRLDRLLRRLLAGPVDAVGDWAPQDRVGRIADVVGCVRR